MSGLAKKIMGGGTSYGQAKAFNGDVATGITAAGSTQGTATALNAAVNLVSTVAAGANGVILPAAEISDQLYVYNDDGAGGDSLTVYPDSGSKINGGATNSGVSLAANTMMLFKKVTSTRWVAMLSA